MADRNETEHAKIDDRNQKSFAFIQKYINAASVERAPAEDQKAEAADKRQHALSL